MTHSIGTVEPTMIAKGSVRAVDLASALKSVVPFAGTDQTIPVLRHIQMTAEGDKLTLRTTDRYTAGRYTIPFEGDAFTALVEIRDVPLILAGIKSEAGARSLSPAQLSLEGHKLTVTTFTGSATVVSGEDFHAFPKIDAVFPTGETVTLDAAINLNAAYLARFAKVIPLEDKLTHIPMRVFPNG